MPSLPKIATPPYPSDFGAVAEFMRPKVREFYQGKAWVHLIDPTSITRGPVDDFGWHGSGVGCPGVEWVG